MYNKLVMAGPSNNQFKKDKIRYKLNSRTSGEMDRTHPKIASCENTKWREVLQLHLGSGLGLLDPQKLLFGDIILEMNYS